jgi:hypothetical protein
MTIVTLCGAPTNEADCGYCLKIKECREAREKICWGCKREFMCPLMFKQKRRDEGYCRGRELAMSTQMREETPAVPMEKTTVDEFTRLHGKGDF